MTDELRYGIVGTGLMGVEHLRDLLALGGARVTALADPYEPSLDAASEALAEHGRTDVLRFHGHGELLASGACDVVVVATPNFTHADVLLDVLAADVHVLVEKPLCTSVSDCRRVIAAAEGRAKSVWVGLEYRYLAPVARLVEEVRAGATGPVRMVALREHRYPFLPKVGDWNRFNRYTGGTLVEKCCHFFDLMRLVTGAEPVTVLASGGQALNHLTERYDGETPDILDNAYVIVEFESGARAMLDLCMFADATQNEQEISVVGDAGKVEVLIPDDVVRIGHRGPHWVGNVETLPVPSDAAYEGYHRGASFRQHQRFLEAVRTGGAPEVTLADGLVSVAMGVAAQRSIAERRPVPMEEVLGE